MSALNGLEALYLRYNRLSGEIPPELGNMPNLKALHLRNNELNGRIPPELGCLTKLERLELSLNNLSGEIPGELGNLINLRELLLRENELSGEIPLELGNLLKLRVLNLRANQLSGEIPPELGNLLNLDVLTLAYNQLIGCISDDLTAIPTNDFRDTGLQLCTPVLTGAGYVPPPNEWTGGVEIPATASSADMVAVGDYALSGALHLVQIARQTKVTVALEGAGPGPFAAAIRRGGCPSEGQEPSGQFEYLLFDVVDGESISMVNTPAQFFQFSLSYVVVVEGTDLQNDPVMACGNIPSPLR